MPTGILNSERKRGLVDELTRTVFEVDGHPVFTEARPSIRKVHYASTASSTRFRMKIGATIDGHMWSQREVGALIVGPSSSPSCEQDWMRTNIVSPKKTGLLVTIRYYSNPLFMPPDGLQDLYMI